MSATLTTTAPAATVTRNGSALQAALAAVSVAGDADTTARATLAAVVLSHYTEYASPFAREAVLPVNYKGEVSGRIWLAATERIKPVPAAERTAGETSMAQYLSRYATVATTVGYGLPALASTESANAAYKEISEGSADSKRRAADVSFIAWLSGQSPEVQKGFKVVKRALATDGGSAHLAAALRDLATAPTGI